MKEKFIWRQPDKKLTLATMRHELSGTLTCQQKTKCQRDPYEIIPEIT